MACRLLLAGMAVFGVLIMPLGFSDTAEASEHHSHPAMTHDGDRSHGESGDADHALFHCGAASCAPAYIAGGEVQISFAPQLPRSRNWHGDDPFLPSLYLDCDPPVPRVGFSQA